MTWNGQKTWCDKKHNSIFCFRHIINIWHCTLQKWKIVTWDIQTCYKFEKEHPFLYHHLHWFLGAIFNFLCFLNIWKPNSFTKLQDVTSRPSLISLHTGEVLGSSTWLFLRGENLLCYWNPGAFPNYELSNKIYRNGFWRLWCLQKSGDICSTSGWGIWSSSALKCLLKGCFHSFPLKGWVPGHPTIGFKKPQGCL